MKIKGISIWTVFKVAFLAFMVLITIYPFIYMTSVSLSDKLSVMRNEIVLFPKGVNIESYKMVLREERIAKAYLNTIIYVVLGTAISMILTTIGAYGLSKSKRLIGFKFFNIVIVVTMFFGGGMIPKYLVVKSLGLLDTIWAVVLPSSISAWNLIVMRTFFINFPEEIEQSGWLDGLNDFGILFYLVIPTSGAILATMSLFHSVGYWNSFMEPFLYLKTESKYPLQVILRSIIIQGSSLDNEYASGDSAVYEDSLKFATIIVSVIPIICIYPFLQKYFVKGVMIGSLKG
ncbi:MAG TPA: carbohydrate ABC transporter permease [Clostridiales bacterium]|nr:carbohydrate ABC transporter permease [Clostridiales bacterium]